MGAWLTPALEFPRHDASVCQRRLKFPTSPVEKSPPPKAPGRCRRPFPFCPLSFILGRVCGTARSRQGRAGFARRSGPLPARTVLQGWRGRKGGWSVFLLSSREQTRFSSVLQPVTFTADVDRRRNDAGVGQESLWR